MNRGNHHANNPVVQIKSNPTNSSCCSSLSRETVSDLELALTNSAISYEYALNALDKIDSYGIIADRLISELEQHKQKYFEIRSKLFSIDLHSLVTIEKKLIEQKKVMFSNQTCLQ